MFKYFWNFMSVIREVYVSVRQLISLQYNSTTNLRHRTFTNGKRPSMPFTMPGLAEYSKELLESLSATQAYLYIRCYHASEWYPKSDREPFHHLQGYGFTIHLYQVAFQPSIGTKKGIYLVSRSLVRRVVRHNFLIFKWFNTSVQFLNQK